MYTYIYIYKYFFSFFAFRIASTTPLDATTQRPYYHDVFLTPHRTPKRAPDFLTCWSWAAVAPKSHTHRAISIRNLAHGWGSPFLIKKSGDRGSRFFISYINLENYNADAIWRSGCNSNNTWIARKANSRPETCLSVTMHTCCRKARTWICAINDPRCVPDVDRSLVQFTLL